MAAEAVDVLMSFSGNSDLTPHMEEIMSCAKGNRDVGDSTTSMVLKPLE